MSTATTARDNFESSIQGLKKFKSDLIPFIANQGHFTGYDGRKVLVPNQHKVLAGILQNGEAVIMKHSMIRWHKEVKSACINAKCVGFVHDEWVTDVFGTREEADEVGRLQSEAIVETGKELGLLCPLAASTDTGHNWSEVH